MLLITVMSAGRRLSDEELAGLVVRQARADGGVAGGRTRADSLAPGGSTLVHVDDPDERKQHAHVSDLRRRRRRGSWFVSRVGVSPLAWRMPADNGAERDIRIIKHRQKVTGCRAASQGPAVCAIRSYLSTDAKQAKRVFEVLVIPPRVDPGYPQTR